MRCVLTLTLFFAACADGDLVIVAPDLPETAAYVALVLSDEALHREVTPLFESTKGPFRSSVSHNLDGIWRARLLAYDTNAIEPFVPDFSPLAIATPRDPTLTPSYHGIAQVVDGVATMEPDTDPLELTASWLPDCPGVLPDPSSWLVDTNCGSRTCEATVESETKGCSVVIDTGDCGLGKLTGTIDGNDVITLPANGDIGPCTEEEHPSIDRHIRCEIQSGSCRIDLHRGGFAPALSFTKTAVRQVSRPIQQSVNDLPSQHVVGLAVLADRIAVAVTTDQPFKLYDCDVPMRLAVLDSRTLQEVSTSTLPNCVADLIADPTSDGLLFVTTRPPSVSRMTMDGRITATASIAHTELTDHHYPHQLLADADRVYVVMLGDSAPGFVVAYSLPTLEQDWLSQSIGEGHLTAAAFGGSEDLILLDTAKDDLFAITLNEGNNYRFVPGMLCGQGIRFHDLAYSDAGIAVTSHEITAGVHVYTESGCQSAYPFEASAHATAIAHWPPQPERFLVGLTTKEDMKASFALFDATEIRFLPGAVEVGDGIISRIITKGDVLYALLPWTAEVVRLTH